MTPWRAALHVAICAALLPAAAASGAPGNPRYLVLGVWNWDANDDLDSRFRPLVDAAVAVGFNAVRVHLPWYAVEAEPGVDANLGIFDARLDYVIRERRLKAVVSIDLTRRGPDAVVPVEALQQDGTGTPAHGINDRYMVSFASDAAVEAAAAFVGRIVARYGSRYGGDAILAYNVTYSLYAESEYWVGGRLLDYSPAAQAAFRAWLARRFGATEALNAAWGTAYTSFDAVDPPPGFGGPSGLSWYQFRHAMLARMNRRMAQAIRDAAPGARVAQQYGSVWDAQAAFRGTLAFPALCEGADLVCVDDAPDYPFAWSMDLLRGSLVGRDIANECDRPAIGSDAQYLEQVRTSFAHGAACVFFANWDDPRQFAAHEAALFAPARALLAEPVPNIAAAARMEVSARSLLRQGAAPALAAHLRLSSAASAPVDVLLIDDLSADSGTSEPSGTLVLEGDEGPASRGAAAARLRIRPFPNPANGGMVLLCETTEPAGVEVAVYGLNGQRLRVLAAGSWSAGVHRLPWDGRDAQGRELSSGVYLARLRAGHEAATCTVVRLR